MARPGEADQASKRCKPRDVREKRGDAERRKPQRAAPQDAGSRRTLGLVEAAMHTMSPDLRRAQMHYYNEFRKKDVATRETLLEQPRNGTCVESSPIYACTGVFG